MNCETAYLSTGDARAGLLAARAAAATGRAGEAAVWSDRLAGTAQEGDVLEVAGEASFAAGDLETAESLIRRELALRRDQGDGRAVARCAYKLAFLALRESDYLAALDHADTAYAEALAADHRELAGVALETLHAILVEIGDLEGAERALDAAARLIEDGGSRQRLEIGRGLLYLQSGRPQIAISTFQAILDGGDGPVPRVQQSAHLNLVEANLLTGDLDAARRHVDAAWALAGEQNVDRALLHALRAKVAAAEGAHAAALADLDRAAAISTRPHQLQEIHYDRGRALEASGRPAEAQRAYDRAIELIEQARVEVGPDDFKEWLLAKRRRPYERLFRLQAGSGRDEEAVATAERIKARTFMEAFLRATAPADGESTRPELGVARRGRDRLQNLAQLLPALGESPAATARPIEEILAALPVHYVLYFLQVDDEMWRLELDAGRLTVAPLSRPASSIADLTKRLLSTPDDRDAADELGRTLLDGATLPGSPPLLHVVTDGPLGELPFALLRVEGDYLAERYEISYVPSLTALTAIEERRWEKDATGVVVLADPLGDLPAAAAEGRDVADRFGAVAHLGQAADSAVLAATRKPRLVHLATHSSLGPAGPSLVLADRSLGAADLLDQPPDAGIVVLASCASASRRGAGLWGSMGGAFLAGGARVVVASLWSIEDREAHEFVARLYREGVMANPARALARTQRGLLAEGKRAEHWAPFVLLGSARALAPIERNGGER